MTEFALNFYAAAGNIWPTAGYCRPPKKAGGLLPTPATVIANAREWSYREHWEFEAEVVPRIARETGRNEVHSWARSANELHRNFYRDVLDAPTISEYLNDVESFVNLIRGLVNRPAGG